MLATAVFAGGMIGAWARFELAGRIHERVGGAFPWGTLAVNITGSFVLGCILPLLDAVRVMPPLHAFITTGVLGAFTTFSTFAFEAVMLLQEGERGRAAAYVGASVVFGLTALAAGLVIGTSII